MILPKKCLIDTNVPKTANLALAPNQVSQELAGCVLACVEAVIKNNISSIQAYATH